MVKRLLPLLLAACLLKVVYAADPATVIPEVKTRSQHVKKSSAQEGQVQTTHLTREQIANSPVNNLSTLLRREQSIVRVTHNGGDGSQPVLSIRGFGDNAAANSLILVDGFPLTNPSLLAPNFNSIALLDIERIDIIQGSEGTLWGDQAVGGVVNIITRHPEKIILDTQFAYGSYNQQFFSGLYGGKAENGLFLKVFGFGNKTDNYRAHNNASDNTLSGQLGLDYARGSLSLNVQTLNNNVLSPGSLTESQYRHHPRMATNDSFHSHFKTNRYWLLSKHELNEDWLLETRVAHTDINGDGFLFADYWRYETVNSIEPRLVGHWRHNKVTAGFYQQNSTYRITSGPTDTKTAANQSNVFGQVIIPVLETVDLTLGAREAWQNNTIAKVNTANVAATNRVFVTEQGLSYHPNTAWRFYVRRDGNFRFPKANEEAWTPTGVAALQAQTGVSYEAGTVWTTEQQKAQANFYHLDLHNEIAFDPTPMAGRPFGSFKNFNNTVRDGVTLTEAVRIKPDLNIYGQFNYVRARFASGPFSGNTIPAVPAINANAGVNYEFLPRWHAQYDALYTGSSYASENDGNKGPQMPGYWLSSVALQYEWRYASLSFEVGNVFNQTYSIYTRYNAATQMNTYNPGAGRNYLLTLKTTLD